ncbi:MAG: hypothetical protein P8Y36_09260, partial [Alphaproteobacteria bacterium]
VIGANFLECCLMPLPRIAFSSDMVSQTASLLRQQSEWNKQLDAAIIKVNQDVIIGGPYTDKKARNTLTAMPHLECMVLEQMVKNMIIFTILAAIVGLGA